MKSSTTTNSSTLPNTNRRQSTRSARTTASRPSNYYAKPFGYRAASGAVAENDPPTPSAPGFFPAITHFTDSITALPKEVQRHLTMLNETEGKAHQHDQAITNLVNSIAKLPKPSRPPPVDRSQAFLYLSLANSAAGSLNGSTVDGFTPQRQQPFLSAGSHNSDPSAVNEQALERQDTFRHLCERLMHMSGILDEKNMFLSAANDALARELVRLDSSFAHIPEEVSEEARLGSNTHWALPHMKELRRAHGGAAPERSKRDIQATNSLAAAAAAIHEGDIAATRSEARREAVLARRNKTHHLDSDMENRTMLRKAATTNKVRKVGEVTTEAKASGAGPSGPSHKKRRVEKSSAAPNERAMSAALNGRLGAGRASPRDTPLLEANKKKNKPPPSNTISKKKIAADSPSILSSPTRGTFSTTIHKTHSPAPIQRHNTARPRQDSLQSTTNEGGRKRPSSTSQAKGQGGLLNGIAEAKANIGNKIGGHRSSLDSRYAQADGSSDTFPVEVNKQQPREKSPAIADNLKREDVDTGEAHSMVQRPAGENTAAVTATQAADVSRRGSRSSKPATPADGVSTETSRSRPARAVTQNGSHGRGASPKPTSPKKARNQHTAEVNASRDASMEAEVRGRTRKGSVSSDGVESRLDEDEPGYCTCGGVSYGQMVACDNENCPWEWFHLGCVGLDKPPPAKTKWYCRTECREEARRLGRR